MGETAKRMEKGLQTVGEEIFSKTPPASGVVISDENGLCLLAKGAKANTSGPLAALVQRLQALDEESPVTVTIESDLHKITAQKQGKVTVSIFEKSSEE